MMLKDTSLSPDLTSSLSNFNIRTLEQLFAIQSNPMRMEAISRAIGVEGVILFATIKRLADENQGRAAPKAQKRIYPNGLRVEP